MLRNHVDELSSELPRMPMFLTDFAVHCLGEIVLDHKYTLGRQRKSAAVGRAKSTRSSTHANDSSESQSEDLFYIAPVGYTATRSGPSATQPSHSVDVETPPVSDSGSTMNIRKKGTTVDEDVQLVPIMLKIFKGPYFVVIPSDAKISSSTDSIDASAVVAAVTPEVLSNNGPLPNGVVVGSTPFESWKKFIKERRPASAATITSAVANAMFGLSDINVQRAIHLLPNAKALNDLAAECERKVFIKRENVKRPATDAKCKEDADKKNINDVTDQQEATNIQGCFPDTVKPTRRLPSKNATGAISVVTTITSTPCPVCNLISPFCALNGTAHPPAHSATPTIPASEKCQGKKQKVMATRGHNSTEATHPLSDISLIKEGGAHRRKRDRKLSAAPVLLDSATLEPGVQTKRRRRENSHIAVSSDKAIPEDSIHGATMVVGAHTTSISEMPIKKRNRHSKNPEQTKLTLMEGGIIPISEEKDSLKLEQLHRSNSTTSPKKKTRTPKIDANGSPNPPKSRESKKVVSDGERDNAVMEACEDVNTEEHSKISSPRIRKGKSHQVSNTNGKTQMSLTFDKFSKAEIVSSGVKPVVSNPKLQPTCRPFFNKRSNILAKQIYNDENGVHSDASLEALGLLSKGHIRAFKVFIFQYLSERSKTNLVKKVMAANSGKLPEKYQKVAGGDASFFKSRGCVTVKESTNMPSSIVIAAAADRAPNARKAPSGAAKKQIARQTAPSAAVATSGLPPTIFYEGRVDNSAPLNLSELPVQTIDNTVSLKWEVNSMTVGGGGTLAEESTVKKTQQKNMNSTEDTPTKAASVYNPSTSDNKKTPSTRKGAKDATNTGNVPPRDIKGTVGNAGVLLGHLPTFTNGEDSNSISAEIAPSNLSNVFEAAAKEMTVM